MDYNRNYLWFIYRGLNPTQFCGDYFKKHERKIPIKTTCIMESKRVLFFMAHVDWSRLPLACSQGYHGVIALDNLAGQGPVYFIASKMCFRL